MGAGARAWPDAIMPTLVAHCPGMQCAMVGACCYSTCHAVPALVAEVERLRAVETAARVVVADDHQMRSVHAHWEALYAALGVPRGTEAERWAAGQAGR